MSKASGAGLREEDIRPAAIMADRQRCIEADRDFLLSRRSEWVEVPCPACDGTNHHNYGEKLGFSYVECDRCGTVYTNPRPSQELSHAFYAKSQNYEYWNRYVFPATENVRRTCIFRPRAQRLAQYCRKLKVTTDVLLEVGAAFGTFIEEMRDLRLFGQLIAVEPTPDLAATCRHRGLEVIESPIEAIKKSAFADVVAAFEVVEHLFSPRTFIQQCHRLLRPRGLLVLTCPNVRGFDIATLRTLSNTFDHEHVNYFHTDSLPALVSRCGFKIVNVKTPGQLDCDLVRKNVQEGRIDLSQQTFLKRVLVDDWNTCGLPFQKFLAANQLSSHMWVVAART